MKKKVLAILLSATLTLSLSFTSYATDSTNETEPSTITQNETETESSQETSVSDETDPNTSPTDSTTDITDAPAADSVQDEVTSPSVTVPDNRMEEDTISESNDDLGIAIQSFAEPVQMGNLVTVDNITYTVTSDVLPYTVEAIDISDDCTELSIPASIQYNDITYSVTSVSQFSGKSSLSTIIIAEGIQNVSADAFTNCENVRAITIPSTLKTFTTCGFKSLKTITQSGNTGNSFSVINNVLFYHDASGNYTLWLYPSDYNNVQNYSVPEYFQVCAIQKGAFAYNKHLNKIEIPDTVTRIEKYAFFQCQGLASFVIGTNISYFGEYNLYQCLSLKSVLIEANIGLRSYCINSCPDLQTVTINGLLSGFATGSMLANKNLESFVVKSSPYYTAYNNVLYQKNGDNDHYRLIRYPSGSTSDCFIVPDETAEIASYAFNDISNTSKIILSPNIILKENAFINSRYNSFVNSPMNVSVFFRDTETVHFDKSGIIFSNAGQNSTLFGCNQSVVDSINSYDNLASPKINVSLQVLEADSITLSSTKAEINVNDTYSLTSTLEPYYSTDSVTWQSTNSDVASVDNKGNITGLKCGSTIIKCTTSSGKQALCNLTVVRKISSITLPDKEITLTPGETSDELTATISPADATCKDLIWTSSDPSIVEIVNGKLVAHKSGTVTIKVTAADGSGITASFTVHVTAKPVQVSSITLDKTNLTLHPNDTTSLNASVLPANAANKELQWISTNTDVAIVINGVVIIKSIGTTSIVAKATDGSNVSATCAITVSAPYSTIENGIYTISSQLKRSSVLDIANGQKADGANVQLFTSNNTDAQKFRFTHISDGYYRIECVQTEKVLDVQNKSASNGTNLQQWTWNGSDAQLWRLIKQSNGSYMIVSKLGTVIDLTNGNISNTTNIQLHTSNNTAAQNWFLSQIKYADIPEGIYSIGTQLNTAQVMDVSNAATHNGGNIQLYHSNNTEAQKYKISKVDKNFYRIENINSGKVLDVSGGSSSSRTNLQQWDWTNCSAQLWRFIESDNAYIIESKLGTVIDASGGTSSNGTNLQLYSSNNTAAQKWILKKITINSLDGQVVSIASKLNTNTVLDVSGGSTLSGANIQLYQQNWSAAQKFRLVSIGNGYYKIVCQNSGKVLDVHNAGSANGTNVKQWDWNGSTAQKWMFILSADGSYTIKSELGHVLDVSGGNTANGTNIQCWSSNNTNAQKWILK